MLPEAPPSAAAVVCHAHPLHGGMMHFKVVFRAAKALQSAGLAVLRFNFRGVGRSEGVHDHGSGEQEDARAALREMQDRFPGLPLLLGGFSFGSAVALRVAARDERVRAVFALGYSPAPVIPRDSGWTGPEESAGVADPRASGRSPPAAPLRPGRERRVRPRRDAARARPRAAASPRDRRDPGRRPLLRGEARRTAGRDRRLGRASPVGRRRPSLTARPPGSIVAGSSLPCSTVPWRGPTTWPEEAWSWRHPTRWRVPGARSGRSSAGCRRSSPSPSSSASRGPTT